MIFGNIFFRFMKLLTGLLQYGGRHSGGDRGITEAPRSVKFIDLCKILEVLCKKKEGLKLHFTLFHYFP
jgi:hypothetical protein